MPEQEHTSVEGRFPPWTRYVEAAIPVALAVAVACQHDALAPLRWPALLAAVAAAPWVIGLVVHEHQALLRPLGSLVAVSYTHLTLPTNREV